MSALFALVKSTKNSIGTANIIAAGGPGRGGEPDDPLADYGNSVVDTLPDVTDARGEAVASSAPGTSSYDIVTTSIGSKD